MIKYFHLFADEKTVEEITEQEFWDYVNYYGSRPRKLARKGNTWISVYHRNHPHPVIPIKQLKEIFEY